MYKKILLSSAIAAALGTAGIAQAGVSLDKPNGENPLTFAQEATVDAAGTDLNVTAAGAVSGDGIVGANVAVETKLGFTIGDGTSKYVRLTFDEPLAANLADEDFGVYSADGVTDAIAGATATASISTGGTAGDTFVIVEVSATGADLTQNDIFTFEPQTGDEIEATAKNTRNISYRLYEFAADALNEQNVLVTKSAQWITWASGLSISCTANSSVDQINVVDPKTFLDGLSTNIATVSVGVVPGVVSPVTNLQVDIVGDYYANGSAIAIEGSTAAFNRNCWLNDSGWPRCRCCSCQRCS